MKKEVNKRIAAQALAGLDFECLAIGDNWREIVENLCDIAGVAYPNGNKDLMETCTAAYETILDNDPAFIKNELGYYQESADYLINQIAFYVDGENSIRYIGELFNYIMSHRNEKNFDSDCVKTMYELNELFSGVDVKLLKTGYFVGANLWKYMNPAKYMQTNSSFIVGHALSEDDPLSENGRYKYLCHIEFSTGRDGYGVFLERKGTRIYANIREYSEEIERGRVLRNYGPVVISKPVTATDKAMVELSTEAYYLPVKEN